MDSPKMFSILSLLNSLFSRGMQTGSLPKLLLGGTREKPRRTA